MKTILFFIFSFILTLTVMGKKAWKEDQIEFLFENQMLCGNPFAQAEWIPVLDMCTQQCDPISEICVENDELVQKCNKLPDECVQLFRGKQDERQSITNPLDTGAFGLVLMQQLRRSSGRSGRR